MVSFMCILYICLFVGLVYRYNNNNNNNNNTNIYLRYYGKVKKHENVGVVSDFVVGKGKPFVFFRGVI